MNYLEEKKKAMMNYVSGGRLPSAYQEVEWIGSSGTQWIDTNIPISTFSSLDTNWSLNFALIQSSIQILMGADVSKKQLVVEIAYFRKEWGTGADGGFNTRLQLDTRYETKQEDGYFYLNEEFVPITNITTSSIHCGLFCKLKSNLLPETNTLAKIKIYSFNADTNGTPIINLIPCYRKADDVIGMYDTVTQTFYTNSGSGTFTKGADV